MRIVEGMRAGDLEDLVLPLISVDEYVSKISEKACVVGFYVSDADAAGDLNRFLQKTPTAILDTEISPAPDQQGYYLVFVEVLQNRQMPSILKMLLDDVSPLTKIDDWDMRLRGLDGVVPFSEEKLADHLGLSEKPDETEVMEFFVASDLKNVLIEGASIVLSGAGGEFAGKIVAFGAVEEILHQTGLEGSAVILEAASLSRCSKLALSLGRQWRVDALAGSYVMIAHGDRALLASL